MTETNVETRELTKLYGGSPTISALDITVQKGHILALVGPSGSGKTTLLRLIAGLEQPDAGQVILSGNVVADHDQFLPPEKRRVGMVFQEYALFPRLTVADNVGFGLDAMTRSDRQERVLEMLAVVGLAGYTHRYPHELSGGERQRVALARALAPEPVILLLDEPFSSLDADRRLQVKEEVRGILKQLGATAIFVTHDQEEALYMGDRLGIMNKGCLEQIGTPEAVFHAPVTRFVAEFMGQTDFLSGETTPEGILTDLGLVRQRVDLPVGEQVELAVRADDVDFSLGGANGAEVVARQFTGPSNLYRLRLTSGQVLHTLQPHTRVVSLGTPVHVSLNPGHPLTCFHQGRAV